MTTHKDKTQMVTKQDALDFHEFPTPGKVSIAPTKKLVTAWDLSLAYSPGVAYPCIEIQADEENAYWKLLLCFEFSDTFEFQSVRF